MIPGMVRSKMESLAEGRFARASSAREHSAKERSAIERSKLEDSPLANLMTGSSAMGHSVWECLEKRQSV